MQDRAQNRRRRSAWERAPPGEHFIKDGSKRKDIGTGVGGFAFRLLRRHVGRSADDRSRLGRAERVLPTPGQTVQGDLLRQPEIKKLGDTSCGYKDVPWL